jgi:hypothetical protein
MTINFYLKEPKGKRLLQSFAESATMANKLNFISTKVLIQNTGINANKEPLKISRLQNTLNSIIALDVLNHLLELNLENYRLIMI